VGLQMCVELIVFLHARFASCDCRDTGTEFLKVYTYPIGGVVLFTGPSYASIFWGGKARCTLSLRGTSIGAEGRSQ
jgi:hypothetical protein